MLLAAILTGLCAAYAIALVVAERLGARRLIYLAKPSAAIAFVGVGIAHALSLPAPGAFAVLTLAGLALGAAGDVALMLRSERAFLAGLGLFLLGHLAYLSACAVYVSPMNWIGLLAIGPIAGALVALAWLAPHLRGSRLRTPVVLYVTAIVTMLIAALALARHAPYPDLSARGAYLFCAGAALFSASDLAVARQRFVAAGFVNKAWGLPAYFAGQLLVAWSLAPG